MGFEDAKGMAFESVENAILVQVMLMIGFFYLQAVRKRHSRAYMLVIVRPISCMNQGPVFADGVASEH